MIENAVMGFFTLAMLFFSYFGVSTAPFTLPVLGAMSLDRICSVFALGIVASRLAAGWKARNRLESLYFLYTGFILVYGALSLTWSGNLSYSFRQYANIVLQALLSLAVLMQFGDGDEDTVDRLVVFIFIINMAAGFFEMATKHYLLQRSNEYIAEYRLLRGFAPPLVGFYNTNDFCIAMAQLLPLVVYRVRKLPLQLLAILSVLAMTTLAFSDLALIATLAYAAWFVYSRAIRSRFGMAFLLLAISMLALLAPAGIDRIMERTRIGKRVELAATDSSVLRRLALYGNALAISIDHFGGGLGTGNSERVLAEYSATHANTFGIVNLHSFFLHLLVEYGWTGLLLFLALLWGIFKSTRAIPPGMDLDLKMLCYGSLIMLPFTMSSSSNSITSTIGWITFALLILHLNRYDRAPVQEALA